mmetsp:Transcript_26921/g.39829  ORF Transcript_26921/g.39829 Transcript_26921/m.39829 type:complete len:210 (+) Transcript_26921:115-744(+)|eukprot:CAMPEP_0194252502 /NCGR_PEP_ID=MMETSP0158-20130606/27779_1 /TAXON_ID=33649 /ORGANISM="Thalassionema nitzschioides, Strain L26-B" /LENGTH=209 /DNA_ID=CAMNT_0038989933 /DNA_START=20 /DNA_END=649 /DNA_ORIENTATION=+
MKRKSTENSGLPLGWTQIRRDQRNPISSSNTSSVDCCDDPTCQSGGIPPPRFTRGSNVLKGEGIFCLCEIDPSWFQGYFVVDKKPFRLLAQRSVVDEDLICCMGGEDYREIQLQVLPPSGRFQNTETEVSFSKIQWTGGDMMNLRGEKLCFETKRFFSGKAAIPIMRQYFMAMVKKLLDHEESDDKAILDIIPDVSVVVGKMKLVLPQL